MSDQTDVYGFLLSSVSFFEKENFDLEQFMAVFDRQQLISSLRVEAKSRDNDKPRTSWACYGGSARWTGLIFLPLILIGNPGF